MTATVAAGAAGLRAAWRGARALEILGVLLAMLALNVATLTISSVNAVAGAILGAVSSVEPFGAKDRRARAEAERRAAWASEETAGLARRLEASEAGRVAELGRADELAARNAYLLDDASRAAGEARELRRALAAAEAAQWVELGGERMPVREAVGRVTEGVQRCTAQVPAANLGSMAGESIPFWGIGIVVAATAYELKSSCESKTEMRALEVALGVAEAGDEEVGEVCGMQAPSREDLADDEELARHGLVRGHLGPLRRRRRDPRPPRP